jgi:nucleotide-binding universal stress UspA family protein
MTFLVPYDATDLADAALERAADFGRLTDTAVEATTVLPEGDREFAADRGLLDPDEAYAYDLVVDRLRERVADVAPEATFRDVAVDRYAPTGTIANRLRSRAREDDVTLVFLGSENAGRYVASLSSVGQSVAASGAYDVYIVRHAEPTGLAGIDDGAARSR